MKIVFASAALRRLDDIYDYTHDTWGQRQAETYINGLYETLESLDQTSPHLRPIPIEFELEGYFTTYMRHRIYLEFLSPQKIRVVSILHVQMDQAARLLEDLEI